MFLDSEIKKILDYNFIRAFRNCPNILNQNQDTILPSLLDNESEFEIGEGGNTWLPIEETLVAERLDFFLSPEWI